MNNPQLIIFDIDATLVRPGTYYTPEQVLQGLYDAKLLTPFLTDPNYQIALASFNHDPYQTETPYAGRRLGRLILDLQHPAGNSNSCVEDNFIQAWMFQPIQQANQHGKNEHIKLILQAYHDKYGGAPPLVILYDDRIENVYLAGKNGIRAFWVTAGLRRDNIHTFSQIGNRVLFSIREGQIEQYTDAGLRAFAQYIHKHARLPNNTLVYSLYLPPHRDTAKLWYSEFIACLYRSSIDINVITSDLNYIV